ncbi:MAG: hypothetical protein R2759_13130 [Bacteroidales bacterium]
MTFVIFSSYPGLIKDSFEIFPNQEKDFWYWSKLGGSNTDAPVMKESTPFIFMPLTA